jgi:hypothetical protein
MLPIKRKEALRIRIMVHLSDQASQEQVLLPCVFSTLHIILFSYSLH